MNQLSVGGTADPNTMPLRRRRLGRGVFILPSMFTVGNIFCGYFAILSTMHGNYDQAAQAIGIAIVLDMLDGRIARLTNSATSFGLQLDSLADVVSFGIAPSVLALVWGLGSLDSRLAWTAAFTFTICGAMRLARFNVQAGHFKHFVGLPIPAGGGTIAAIVHFFGAPIKNSIGANCMVAGVFVLAFLMVSTIRYSSLKYLTLGKKSHLTILVIALLVALIYFYSKTTLLGVAIAYSLSGLAMRLTGFLRRKKPVEDLALADPVEHH
ncbi:MAG TPA: CDP-diacylglycerol--serine O-phosphatidyltransferase [Acidobacteriota bacterium]|nr:CDP-diacylglycerol--serine O-phosphatidyltransferase [Acidobacteriota bacterium]